MRKIRRNPHSGQAVMEFVLGLLVVFSFFFFFIRMSALFAVGNYIHYSTFMAARAFSSSAPNQEEQVERANSVLDSTVRGRFRGLIRENTAETIVGPGPFYAEDAANDFWNQGVSFPFKTKLALYPWSRKGQAIELELVSESWMPREVTEKECNESRERIQGAVGVPNVKVEWDNGC